jgi:Mg2+/Co2+ transporter CorC
VSFIIILFQKEKNAMENLTVRDLMVPADKFPKISDRASFYEALAALETAQEKYLSGKSGQRILLVENEARKIMGKLSPIDLLRGLETNYNRLNSENTLSRFGLSHVWKSLQQDYHLWESPFKDLCRKAEEVKVKDFIKGPCEGQYVGMADSMAKCFHLFITNRHDALFVMEEDRIVGLLRFSDVYKKTFEIMNVCHRKAL